MVYDKVTAKLFIQNFNEAHRRAELLQGSHERLSNLIPLKDEPLEKLDIEILDKLDAFRVRFFDLQDTIGNRLFKGILLLEGEPKIGSFLDILFKMEKRSILKSYEQWKSYRDIRYLFYPEYLEKENERSEGLNLLYQATPELIEILNNIKHYLATELQLSLEEPFIKLTPCD